MTDLELDDIRGRAEHVPASAWQNAEAASDDEIGPILAFVRKARCDVLNLVEEIKRLRLENQRLRQELIAIKGDAS